MSWLIVTEKQKAAERIAYFLFKDVKKIDKGKLSFFYSPSADAYVLGLRGHIVELDFPGEYRDWIKTDIFSLINARLVRVEKEKEIISLLKDLAKKVERVTIATDYDREGELIGLEALEILRSVNRNLKFNRARFSAITKEEILRAFSNLESIDFNLAFSALARQEIDLIWGAVLTRLVSLGSGRLGKDFLSVGRVQTPTLRLIVEREKEIENFKPEKFYEIYADFGFIARNPSRYKDLDSAKKVLSQIGDFAVVRRFEVKRKSEAKPKPFNTTEFLREASRFMPPHEAMEIAETLYLNGYISYPRTDNTVYPESLDLIKIVRAFLNSSFSKEAKLVLDQEKIEPSRGKKRTTDHPPIYPTAVAERSELEEREWIIYELIVRRFLATLARDALWEIRLAELESNGIRFISVGRKLVELGWRAIYPYSDARELEIPLLSIGERLRIKDKKIEEKKTKPPPRFTSSALIKLMEKLDLGTKSTRHEIIKKLISRKYIRGNPYKPTALAFAVIEFLKENAEMITLPEMTAKLEKELDAIAEGKKSRNEVVLESRKILMEIISRMDLKKLKELRNLKEEKDEKIIGRCPSCGNELAIKRARKRFLGCVNYPNCKFSAPLPQKGRIYITSKICEKHGARILKIESWTFCPICNYEKLSQ
uniref:DNA topoisomerase 1 n=1 Tax=Archaeoglobus fulgidus TaxID=2234 RepID=A0A7J2TIP0_ARCFL